MNDQTAVFLVYDIFKRQILALINLESKIKKVIRFLAPTDGFSRHLYTGNGATTRIHLHYGSEETQAKERL